MALLKFFHINKKLKKENKKLKGKNKETNSENKLMFSEINKMAKKIEMLQNVIVQQNIGLSQISLNTRDMYFGPNEFILSQNNTAWKDISVTLKGENISDKISKIIIHGPSLIKE